jgi:predicted metal-dependent hydrolase
MNHSPRFWKVVEGLFPAWREVRDELKRRATEIPMI